jgi:D-arabinose 1-dehydrogenase-like Zn-dependent alcohol dehydrogenase
MRSYRVFEFGQPLRPADHPLPVPVGAEVLLRVEAAGVCHSDLHIWEGGYDLGAGRRLMLKDRGIPLPLTMGHEIAGEIVALGPDVADRNLGESCVVYPWIGCGNCGACRDGNENLCMAPRCLGVHCDGGYADHVLVPDARYLVPLSGLDPVVAAPFACSGLTAYAAIKKLGEVITRHPVLVVGAGGLGLMCVAILTALGAKGAVVADIDPKKRAAAVAAGARAAIDSGAPDALAQIQAALAGPCWAAIDLVGLSSTAELAFNALGKGGKMVMVGLFGGAAPWPLPFIPLKAATIQGSYTGNLAEFVELIDLVRGGKIGALPTTRRHFCEATEALEALRQGQVIGRTVMTP